MTCRHDWIVVDAKQQVYICHICEQYMPQSKVTESGVIQIQRLSSGYYHVRGEGPCNWAQVPTWPCTEEVFREHMFPEASESFVRGALSATQPGDDRGQD